MDQKALDDAYDQLVYAPNRDQVHKRNVFNSDRVRARLGAPKRLAYGPTPIEQLDLFATDKPNAPINVFIHGGAWRQRTAKDYAFLAEMFVRAGAHLIALDFDGVEGTNGDLLPMADQVRRARRLGLQERQELRRRSEPHLRVEPVVRRASRRQRRHHRLEGLRRAERMS